MKYATPEIIVLGSASLLVQGVIGGKFDNPGSDTSRPAVGIALGLDD